MMRFLSSQSFSDRARSQHAQAQHTRSAQSLSSPLNGFRLLLLLLLITGSYSVQAWTQIPDLQDRYLTLPDGQTMHYYDEGNPDGKPLLMVHGYPTSAFLYRNIVADLCPDETSEYRCIAMTHIGFGKSSCPDEGYDVGPVYAVSQLEAFILAMDLTDFATVVHDWGGPIGTLASLRHSERVSHLVILNTMLTFPEKDLVGRIMDFAEEWFSTQRTLIEWSYDGLVGTGIQALTNHHLTRKERAEYEDPFNGELGACRAHAGVNLFAKAHSEEGMFAEIADRAVTDWANKPTVLFWGLDDPLFGNRTQKGIDIHERIEALFPQAGTVVFDANHFMQEDQPEGIAAEIRNFVPVD